jgi:hypothetical protein
MIRCRTCSVEGAVEFEKFLDDIALSDTIASGGGVGDLFEDFDLDEEISVGPDRLACDADVFGKLTLVEFSSRGEVQESVNDDGDALVAGQVKKAAGVIEASLLGIEFLSRAFLNHIYIQL